MESPNNSRNVRDNVFNTINLLNDLESGCPTSSSQVKSKNDEVRLSDTFVNGIKDKMIDPSKIKHDVNKFEIEDFKEKMKTYLEANLTKFKDVIQSQSSLINSLKQEISTLKLEVSSLKESKNFSAESGAELHQSQQDYGVYSQARDNPAREIQPNLSSTGFGNSESSGMIHSTREPVENGIYSQNQSQYSSSSENSFVANSMNSNSRVESSHSPVQEKVVNPRVGNYESSDVLIEKYFYYGNKK